MRLFCYTLKCFPYFAQHAWMKEGSCILNLYQDLLLIYLFFQIDKHPWFLGIPRSMVRVLAACIRTAASWTPVILFDRIMVGSDRVQTRICQRWIRLFKQHILESFFNDFPCLFLVISKSFYCHLFTFLLIISF